MSTDQNIRTWTPSADPQTAEASATTQWRNDRPEVQRIRVQMPTTIRVDDGAGHQFALQTNKDEEIVWQPGETLEVPSYLDSVVHVVHGCGHPRCARAGKCLDLDNAPASAVVMGGSAPLLRRIPQPYGVDDSLKAHLAPTFQAAARAQVGAPPPEDPALARARARREGAK